MFTQCPGCKEVFTITTEKLRDGRALMNCTKCDNQFDALEFLSEKHPDTIQGRYETDAMEDELSANNDSLLQEMLDEQKEHAPYSQSEQQPVLHHHSVNASETTKKTPAFAEPPFFEKKSSSIYKNKELPPSSAKVWRYAVLAMIVLLSVQIFYFERARLVQNKTVRPVLEKVCQMLFCQLPPYRNLSELTILHGSLKPLSENNYQLEAVFTNKGPFPQAYPAIKLGLLKFNGDSIASRIFYPTDYLPENFEKNVIPSDEMVEITLEIVPPETKIGGYTIDLL